MFTTATRPLLHAAATLMTYVALTASAGAAVCPGATKVPTSESEFSQAAGATVCLVNAERSSRGLAALQRDPDLTQAARGHAADMVRRDYYSHTSPGGGTFGSRLRKAGYGSGEWLAGENLGWGTGRRAAPNARLVAWLGSPAHRRILLGEDYRDVGIGVVGGAPRHDGSTPGATYTLTVGSRGTR